MMSIRNRRFRLVLPLFLLVNVLSVLFIVNILRGSTYTDNSEMVQNTLLPPKVDSKAKPTKKLKFDELILGKFLGKGSVNLACFVTMPDWVYEEHNLPKSQPLLLKMTSVVTDSQREILAYGRMSEDRDKARQLKALPLLYGEYNMSNPVYGASKDRKGYKDDDCIYKMIGSYRHEPRIGALVVPYKKKQFIHDKAKTLDDFRHFLRSLIAQLDHAHRLGITNFDLSVGRNVFVDDEGDAVLIDWNGNMYDGDNLYDEEANHGISPPESWFPTLLGHTLALSSSDMYAYDVWQVGFEAAHMIFHPCSWGSKRCTRSSAKALQQTILAIGDVSKNGTTARLHARPNTNAKKGAHNAKAYIDVNVDLAEVAGLDRSQYQPRPFKPFLCKQNQICNATNFTYLDSETEERKQEAVDFLKLIFRLSPPDRATCATLLKHPFLKVNS